MSKFVNYKKRSVVLPVGCKDLLDVLQPNKKSKVLAGVEAGPVRSEEQIAATRNESSTGRLADIEKYVSMVFESRAWSFILRVGSSDELFMLDVDRMDGEGVNASVVVQNNSDEEKAVCSFFARHGLHLPSSSGAPPQFVQGLPWQNTYRIEPCPSEARQVSALLTALSLEAFGLNNESQLCFRITEITRTA